MKIFGYVNARGARVTLMQIDAPKTTWSSPLNAFEEAYAHEQKITGMINDLFNLAAAERDGASHDFLEWFCREQVEEEASAQLIVAQLKMVGDSGPTRFMLDAQLGQRGK
jgi:ferritin